MPMNALLVCVVYCLPQISYLFSLVIYPKLDKKFAYSIKGISNSKSKKILLN